MLRRIILASLLLVVGLFGILTGTTAQNLATIRCRLDAAALPSGGETHLVIEVVNAAKLYGYQLYLNYPAASVDLLDDNSSRSGVNAALGTFLSPDFIVANDVDPQAGRLSLALVQLNPSTPKSGSGELASIHVKTKTAAAIDFAFNSVILSDPLGNQLTTNLEGCALNGGGSPVLPVATSTQLPATLIATLTRVTTSTIPRPAASATASLLSTKVPVSQTGTPLALSASPTVQETDPTATDVPTAAQETATPLGQIPVETTATKPVVEVPNTPTTQSFTAETETKAASLTGNPQEGSSPSILTLGLLVPLVVLGAVGGIFWLRRRK